MDGQTCSEVRRSRVGDVVWPPGAVVVAVSEAGEIAPALPTMMIRAGERVILLAPVQAAS